MTEGIVTGPIVTGPLVSGAMTGPIMAGRSGGQPAPVPSVAPGSVVVGVDDHEDSSERALWEAALWAARHQTDITLVTGIGRCHESPGEVSDSFRRRRALHAVHGAAHRLARSTDIRQRIHTSVIDQSATDALLGASAYASLIVVQRPERRAGARCRVGSMTAAVVTRASCPVLVVHADDQIVMRRGVLAVVDARGPSDSGLAVAFEEARLRGVPLTVARCRTGLRGVSADGRLEPDRVETETLAMVRACQRRFPEVRLQQPFPVVPSQAGLLGLARDCELLVASSLGPTPGERGLCLATRHLIAEAACPVLVVPPGWATESDPGGQPRRG